MLKTSRFQLLISCEELLFAAEKEDCNVMHISKFATQCSIVYYESMVIKCKVSGTWINYDILRSKRVHHQLSDYKNVFCTICNPPVPSDIQLDTCTQFFENDMTKACFKQPETMLTYPYRNVCCKICNHNSFSRVVSHYVSQYLKNSSTPFEYNLHNTYTMEDLLENI